MIGILALQGAFAKHAYALHQLGVQTCYVRRPLDLKGCVGLIIPGGESSTMRHHLEEMGMISVLKQFAEEYPIFGTCAGLILMAEDLKLLDVSVQRNGFGAQIYSFSHPLESEIFPNLKGVFIRAPRITKCSSQVTVLATLQGEPVLILQRNYLAATFHPELTNDLQIHSTYVSMVKGEKFPISHLCTGTESDHASGDDHPAKIRTG